MLARKLFVTDHNTQSVQIKECVKKQQEFCFNRAGLHPLRYLCLAVSEWLLDYTAAQQQKSSALEYLELNIASQRPFL